MTSLIQSKRTKRQAARQNSAKMAISDARLAFTQERPLLCYKRKSPDQSRLHCYMVGTARFERVTPTTPR